MKVVYAYCKYEIMSGHVARVNYVYSQLLIICLKCIFVNNFKSLKQFENWHRLDFAEKLHKIEIKTNCTVH